MQNAKAKQESLSNLAGRDSLLWGGHCLCRNCDLLSPTEAMKHFTVANGLHVKTFAADPDIVSISNVDVDAQGRVWACECVNYRGNNGKRPEGDRILILFGKNLVSVKYRSQPSEDASDHSGQIRLPLL